MKGGLYRFQFRDKEKMSLKKVSVPCLRSDGRPAVGLTFDVSGSEKGVTSPQTSLAGCVTMNKVHDLSEPRFPCL